MVLFLLSLIALCLAGFPIDFDPESPRDTTSGGMWLDSGAHSADVTGNDLSTSFIEFTFAPEYPGHRCIYSVWFNSDRVTHGSFKTGTYMTIPLLRGSIDNSAGEDAEITVMTSGCFMFRYATPLTLGANGGSLYVYDWSPTGQPAGISNLDRAPSGSLNFAESSITANLWNQVARPFEYSHISSQFVDIDGAYSDPHFWASSSVANANGDSYTVIDLSTVTGGVASQTEDAVVEFSVYASLPGLSWAFYVCNSTAGACNNVSNTAQFAVDYNGEAFDFAPGDQLLGAPPDWNSFFLTEYYFIKQTDWVDYATLLGISFDYGFVLPPYCKIWNIDPSHYNDSEVFMVDLRGLDTGANCQTRLPLDGAAQNFTEGGNYGIYGQWGPNYGVGLTTGPSSIICYNDENGQLANPTTTTTCRLGATIGTTSVSTGTVQVNGLTMTNAMLKVPLFDDGLPQPQGGICTALGVPLISQLSNFEIDIGGINPIGPVQQHFLKTRGVGRQFAYGFQESFHTGDITSLSITYNSVPGYAISAKPFLIVQGFAPDLCDPANCAPGTDCVNPRGSADCTITGSPGLVQGNGTTLVPYCKLTSCQNGGECEENPDRSYAPDLWGTGGVINAITCNCANTGANSVSGDPFWGEFCQYPPACDSKPCLNGGTCVDGGNGTFTCDCNSASSPFTTANPTGDRCEISATTPCDYNPCRNGATCADVSTAPRGYTCTCAQGWLGYNCDIPPVDACDAVAANDPCGAVGKCIPHKEAPFTKCLCNYGWTGNACEIPPSICSTDWSQIGQKRDAQEENRLIDVNYCQNSGVCISLAGTAAAENHIACLCSPPWVGARCQWNSTIWAGASSTGVNVVLAVIMALLAVLF